MVQRQVLSRRLDHCVNSGLYDEDLEAQERRGSRGDKQGDDQDWVCSLEKEPWLGSPLVVLPYLVAGHIARVCRYGLDSSLGLFSSF